MITRMLQARLSRYLFGGKALLLIGPRQVGKSTLFEQVVSASGVPCLTLTCDSPSVRAALTNATIENLRNMIGSYRLVLVDEAQRVPGIGLTLKLICDQFPDVQLLVTGSSALDLADRMEEPLTGRKREYNLFPISIGEIAATQGTLAASEQLSDRLIYGSYPDVLNYKEDAKELLMGLTHSYLYKDVLRIEGLRRPALLDKILQALALQVGSEVSYNEVAQLVNSDSKTVERYIDLLEQSFVVFRLGALNRNLRNEIKRGKKIYFYDNGVRNAILQNFAPLQLRADTGALWENFIISERLKYNHYAGRFVRSYFWRTTAQQEIDYIEEADGQMEAFEMKWNPKRGTTRIPNTFLEGYNVKVTHVVTPENYLPFLLPPSDSIR